MKIPQAKSLPTGQASDYLNEHGVPRSKSKLEKLRLIGPDDPRADKGPNYVRDANGIVRYPIPWLDEYIAADLAKCTVRGSGTLPSNFRPGTSRAERSRSQAGR